MVPPIRTIVIYIVLILFSDVYLGFFVIMIGSFFYINIFCNIIKIGANIIIIVITCLATEHQTFCLINNNIRIIYIILGELISELFMELLLLLFLLRLLSILTPIWLGVILPPAPHPSVIVSSCVPRKSKIYYSTIFFFIL